MASIFDIAGVLYDIDDAKIAVNQLDGTFGTLVDIPSVSRLTFTMRNRNQTMRGDGRITAIASATESADVVVAGAFDLRVLEIAMGFTNYQTGSTPNQYTSTKFGAGRRMPYFGIVGRARSDQDLSGTMIFIPYLKIMEQVEVGIGDNEMPSPELRCMALGDPTLLDDDGLPLLIHVKGYETVVALDMPLP